MVKNYWTERVNKIFSKLDASDEKLNAQMLKEYEKAYKEITSSIYGFYDRYANDKGLTFDEAKKRVRQTDLDNYVENANAYRKSKHKDSEALKRLNAQLTTSKINRLELLKYQIEFSMIKAGDQREQLFTDYLKKTSSYIYDAVAKGQAIGHMNPKEIETILQLPWSGDNYSGRLWKNNDLLVSQLQELLVRNAINHQNPKVIAKQLRDKFSASKSATERLTRTESTYVANSTIAKRYADMGVVEYEFYANMDSRTSDICKRLNGKTFKMKDYQPGINAPAMHPNCRSRIVPSDDELAKYDKYLDSD